MNRITRTLATTTTIVACAGAVLVGSPAQAALPSQGIFHGTCRNWSVTYGPGDTATRVTVAIFTRGKAGAHGTVVSQDMAPGELGTFTDNAARDGHVRDVAVFQDGKVSGFHTFWCGARH